VRAAVLSEGVAAKWLLPERALSSEAVASEWFLPDLGLEAVHVEQRTAVYSQYGGHVVGCCGLLTEFWSGCREGAGEERVSRS